MLIKISSLSCY